jgi:hypothetical protein
LCLRHLLRKRADKVAGAKMKPILPSFKDVSMNYGNGLYWSSTKAASASPPLPKGDRGDLPFALGPYRLIPLRLLSPARP